MRRGVCVAVLDHLDSGLETGKPELDAYLDVKAACALPRGLLERWIEASSMERALPRCATWKKLNELFAGSVGSAATLAATALMPDGAGASSLSDTLTGQVHAFAAAIGLIGVLENIGEDWKLGRLLLPLDDLVKFGLGERDIARFAEAGSTAGDDRWQNLMQFEADRIRNLFRGGSRALSALADDGCRRAAAVVGVIAMNRFERLLSRGGDPFQTRMTTSAWRRLACMPRAARLAVDPAAAAKVF